MKNFAGAGWPKVPTTVAGAELSILITLIGLRVAVALAIAVSAPSGLMVSPHPGWYLVAAGLALADCAFCIVKALVTRVLTKADGISGIVIGCLTLLASPVILPWAGRAGAWLDWPPLFALVVTIHVAATCRNRIGWLATGLWFCAAYLVVSIPPGPGYSATVLTTVFGFVAVPFITRVVARGLRELAEQADLARAALAATARQEVRLQHELALRDTAGLLHLLASDTLSPAMRTLLNEQIQAQIAKIKALLSDQPAVESGPGSLVGTVVRACSLFGDVPIEMSVDLAAGVVLPGADEPVLMAALEEVLANVRMHAAASQVVVHAEGTHDAGWEVSIRDDGQGFAVPARGTLPPGLDSGRLRASVVDPLAARGIITVIQSEPGEGTAVTLRAAGPPWLESIDDGAGPGPEGAATRMNPGSHRQSDPSMMG